VVIPGRDGELASLGGNVLVHVPGACITETITLYIEELTKPSQPFAGDYVWANRSFLLRAENEAGEPVTQFDCLIMIQVTYDDEMWEDPGVIAEKLLSLFFWNGETWVPLYPCDGCSIDTMSNVITIWVDHLTEFALSGPTMRKARLPLLMRL